MSIADLPTLAEMQAQRRAVPKHALMTKLEDKTAKVKADTKALLAFRAAVWLRDGGKCRVCHVKVLKTLSLTAKRGEVHHRRGRRVAPADRYTVAEAVLLCLSCHGKVQRHEIEVPK